MKRCINDAGKTLLSISSSVSASRQSAVRCSVSKVTKLIYSCATRCQKMLCFVEPWGIIFLCSEQRVPSFLDLLAWLIRTQKVINHFSLGGPTVSFSLLTSPLFFLFLWQLTDTITQQRAYCETSLTQGTRKTPD